CARRTAVVPYPSFDYW
nr:immunoglobulin heavy chain junction region [Mus musculus]